MLPWIEFNYGRILHGKRFHRVSALVPGRGPARVDLHQVVHVMP